MTPEGSRPDSSTVVPLRRTPISGAPTYAMSTGDDCISIWKAQKATDDDADARMMHVADVPAPITRYKGVGGTAMYSFVDEDGEAVEVSADEIADGKAWRQLDVAVPRVHREAAEFAIRQYSQQRGPRLPMSPKITEAEPPLAPRRGPAHGADPDVGRQVMAWLAPRLGPLGRLTIGAALTAPFLDARGGTPSLWSIVGEGGSGKTMLVNVCASLYGDRAAWFHPFDTTARGLSSYAQQLSYFPVMLDESQGVTSSLTQALTPLIMGSSRMRAARSGAASKDHGKWRSLAFITTNTPLVDELAHEMWNRRLIEIDSGQLWTERPSDPTAADLWWSEVAQALTQIQGWPWQALASEYPAGLTALRFIDRAITTVPLPGPGNLGMIGQLAVAGCDWIAEWTGEESWSADVTDAAAAICLECEERKVDPVRDTARAIIEHRVTEPRLWDGTDREAVAHLDGIDGGVCGITHDDEPCSWAAIFSAKWSSIVDLPTSRLRGTRFRQAVSTTEEDRLTSKVRVGHGISNKGTRTRAYVVCWRALEVLAWDEPDRGATVLQQPALPIDTSTTTPSSAPSSTPLPVDETIPSVPRNRAAIPELLTDGEVVPVDQALDDAVRAGYDEVMIPHRWTPPRLREAGWEVRGDCDQLVATPIIREADDAQLIVRRTATPDQTRDAIDDFELMAGRPLGISPAAFSIKLLHELGKTSDRQPRLQFPSDLDFPPVTDVANPAWWGKRSDAAYHFDRVKSHLPAITQANVAPLWYGESFTHYQGDDVPEVHKSLAGLWCITVPEWDERLPSPVGSSAKPGDRKWCTTELMRLYIERGVQPDIHEAWLAPAHKVQALGDWSSTVRSWLDQDRPGRAIAKELYRSLAGRLTSERTSKGRHDAAYRPDWGWAIRDNAWSSTVRHAYEIADAHGIYPVAVHTDALHYEDPDAVPTYSPIPGEKRQRGAIPLGEGLGHFRTKNV